MGAPVQMYDDEDWMNAPGAELAMAGGRDEGEFDDSLGLRYNPKATRPEDAWYAPRVDQLKRGVISVEDLDDEELVRGQVRDSDGRFRGGPMRRVPAEFHNELMRRILNMGVDKLRGNYLNALDTMVELMNDEETDAGLRFNIAKYVVERLAGKTPERIEMTVEAKPWQTVLQGIIREPGRLDKAVIPGELGNEDTEEGEIVDEG